MLPLLRDWLSLRVKKVLLLCRYRAATNHPFFHVKWLNWLKVVADQSLTNLLCPIFQTFIGLWVKIWNKKKNQCKKIYQSKHSFWMQKDLSIQGLHSRILVYPAWPWYSTWAIREQQSCMQNCSLAGCKTLLVIYSFFIGLTQTHGLWLRCVTVSWETLAGSCSIPAQCWAEHSLLNPLAILCGLSLSVHWHKSFCIAALPIFFFP